MPDEMKRSVCEMCHSRCRVIVHSEKGRLVNIEEDRTFPAFDKIFPPTKACLRLRASGEMLYHPERIRFPLKRYGKKGEGKWQTISWNQAFDEIAKKIKEIKERYGAEAIASTKGTARTTSYFMTRFMNLLGSPNYNAGASNICFSPFITTSAAMFGWPVQARTTLGAAKGGPGGLIGSKCFLIIGFNPAQSYLRAWKSIIDARKSNVKIIVIDPRRTQTAEQADLFLQIKPGTDTALLMSMINVIIEEKLYDKDFVEKWCYGFDMLAQRAKDYPPEKVSEITWISTEDIKEAARMYATNKPAYNINGMGIEQLQDAIEAIQAKYILAAITGNIDNEGGQYIPGPARYIREPELELTEVLSPEQKKKQLGSNRFKLLSLPGYDLINKYVEGVWGEKFACAGVVALPHAPSLYRAILTGKPYPVKCLLTHCSNPMVTQANDKLVYNALKCLELYVVLDWWLTPSAELADYVLPIASWIERPYLSSMGGTGNVIIAGEKALPSCIPGEYDRRTDFEILRELGIRLEQGEFWPWLNLEEVYDYQLKPLGLTHREFMSKGGFDYPPIEYKKYEKMGFGTPTGKVELYSTIFEKLGYDPLPKYEEPFETPLSNPELAKEYPLMLITGGRFQPMYHSEHRQIESLRKKHPDPLVQINPKTANQLGINNGDWVWIESVRGKVRMKCQYFEGINPKVVHCEHGWWFPELPGEEPWLRGVWESNINILTEDDPERCNKLSGGWPLRTALCKIYPCKKY